MRIHSRWACQAGQHEWNIHRVLLTVQRRDRLVFPFTDKWQANERVQVAWGDESLSLTSYTSSHLPTHWHFTSKKKKIREASWLRRLRHQRCKCLAQWGLRPAVLHFQATHSSATAVSLWHDFSVEKCAKIRKLYMWTATVMNTERSRN